MKYTCACMIERKNYCPKGKGTSGTLGQRLHLVPGHGAHVRYSLGTNVNTPFLQVPAPEFGHGAGARVQGVDLVLGHKNGHRVPVRTQPGRFVSSGQSTALLSL